MAEKQILWLVVNEASGSNDHEAVQNLIGALERHASPPAKVIDVQQAVVPDRAALDAAGVGLLAVFAGDGTTNALATGLEGWGGQLLVLPGGTSNLLSKKLHGDLDAEAILAQLPAMRPQRRSCIRGPEGTALIEILAGPGAAWSDVREGLREGDIAEIARSGAEAIRQSFTGPMVAVVEPAVGREEGYTGIRLVPQGGAMLVKGYGGSGAADLLRQGVALAKREYREGPHDDLGNFSKVLCRSLGQAPIELMIDGERGTTGPEAGFSLAEFGLDLLALEQ